MNTAKKVLGTYRKLLKIIGRRAPVMVAMTFFLAIVYGAFTFISTYVNKRIIDDGILVATGGLPFADYIPMLIMFVAAKIIPPVISNLCIYGYVEPRSQMILSTDYKGEILQKLSRVKYEHFENSESVKIMDKGISNAQNSARHMFPMYLFNGLSSVVAAAGLMYMLADARWWLALTVLAPFALQSWFRDHLRAAGCHPGCASRKARLCCRNHQSQPGLPRMG